MDTNQYMIDNAQHGVFFDIGANIGHYTVPMATKATAVHAFEPSVVNFGTLVEHTKDHSNIITNKIALSNSKDTVRLFAHKNVDESSQVGWGGFSINPELTKLNFLNRTLDNYEDVPTITLDEYCAVNNITGITGMKIDVEAAEQFVIEGGIETLKNNNILISLETHLAIDCQKIYDLLTSLGYSIYHYGTTKVDSIGFDQQYICRK
jgi:FkbM family methyltransferase